MPKPTPKHLLGIFFLCAAGLMFELAFHRIVAVQGYGRLGDMAIGTALFGFALSGVFFMTRDGLRCLPLQHLLPRVCLGAGASMVLAHLVTTWVPLDFSKVFAQPLATLGATSLWYLVLTLPFFFIGLGVVALLAQAGPHRKHVGWLYGADLLGAGAGAVLLIQGIALVGGEGMVWTASCLCLVAGLCFVSAATPRLLGLLVLSAGAAGIGVFTIAPAIGIKVHAAKRGYLEDIAADRIIGTHWSAVSRIDVARWGKTRQIWFDGGSMQSRMLPKFEELLEVEVRALREASATLPYRITPRKNALVLASAGGNQVSGALHWGAERVTAVEVDTAVVRHVQSTYNEVLNGLFQRPDVRLVHAEGRSFLRHSGELFDVIQIESAYSHDMLVTGAAGSFGSYLMTAEAFRDYWEHLTEDGVLCISQANGPRLFAQVMGALEDLGVDPAGRVHFEIGHMSLGGNTILVRKTPFVPREVAVIEDHVRQGKVTVIYTSRAIWDAIGRDWRGEEPDGLLAQFCSEVSSRSGAERTAYLQGLPFEALPTTDDKPFYNRYFPFLSRIPDPAEVRMPRELARIAKQARRLGSVPISDIPAIVLLLEAALLALPLFLLPVRRFRKQGGSGLSRRLLAEWGYFACVGLAFIAIEIVLARRFVLFFGSPTVALAVVLGGLLSFAGLGSALLSPWVRRFTSGPGWTLVLLGCLGIAYALGLDTLFDAFRGAQAGVRYGLGLLILLPLGLCMGVPFPAGLGLVAGEGESRVAWAWAINGYASVVGTALLGVGTQVCGYQRMFLAGALLYFLAALCAFWLVSLSRRALPQ